MKETKLSFTQKSGFAWIKIEINEAYINQKSFQSVSDLDNNILAYGPFKIGFANEKGKSVSRYYLLLSFGSLPIVDYEHIWGREPRISTVIGLVMFELFKHNYLTNIPAMTEFDFQQFWQFNYEKIIDFAEIAPFFSFKDGDFMYKATEPNRSAFSGEYETKTDSKLFAYDSRILFPKYDTETPLRLVFSLKRVNCNYLHIDIAKMTYSEFIENYKSYLLNIYNKVSNNNFCFKLTSYNIFANSILLAPETWKLKERDTNFKSTRW